MSETNDNPQIGWCQINNLECLKFTFKGRLTEEDALKAISRWKEMFNSMKDQKIILVWNCIDMTGYEPMARMSWQRTIKELKDQIERIWLITDSAVIKAGANLISIFTSFEIKVVKSEDKISL